MKDLKETSEYTQKEVTICYDIDDCLDSIVPSSVLLPDQYKLDTLIRMKRCFFADDAEAEIRNTKITVRLFTNRKDQRLDQMNSATNRTLDAKSMLREIGEMIRGWIDPKSSVVIVDDRFHAEQVFSDPDPSTNYNTHIASYFKSSGHSEIAHLFFEKGLMGHHKVDLITTILGEISASMDSQAQRQDQDVTEIKEHTVILCDDRFSPEHDYSLEPLMNFLSQTPKAIPQGVTLKIVQFDPYLDRTRLNNYACEAFIPEKIMRKYPKLNTKSIQYTQLCQNERTRYQNRLAKLPNLFSTFLEARYGLTRQEQVQGGYDTFQRALRCRKTIVGTGTYPKNFCKTTCWGTFFLPMAKAYQAYLSNPVGDQSTIDPFQCNKESAIGLCSETRDVATVVDIKDSHAESADGAVPSLIPSSTPNTTR